MIHAKYSETIANMFYNPRIRFKGTETERWKTDTRLQVFRYMNLKLVVYVQLRQNTPI